MIDKALSFLRQELNSYLKLKTGDDNKINLSAIVDQSGRSTVDNNTIAMMMVNMEEERVFRTQGPQTILHNGQYVQANPELKLNVYVLFAANHTDHREALLLISHVVQYFQARNVYDNQESPQLGESIERLIVDLFTLSFEQQNQIWASLGAKYMPSAMYRVRMLILNDKLALSAMPAITRVENSFASNRE
jgi:Pvc16 N-terminal domain